MDKNKEIRALNESKIKKISGGRLSDEEVKEFFPNSKYPSLMKSEYTAATCKKCGKRFARYSGILKMAMEGPAAERYMIRQKYCKECAEEEIKKNPLRHRQW